MNLTVPRHLPQQKALCPGSLNPAALDAVKIMALLSMLVDHINTLFLAKPEPLVYALGRMAFPLFTLIWAMNVFNNPARLQQRANRLWGWACLTQPAFTLAFHHQMPWYALNILFVFASVTQLLALHYRLGNRGIFVGAIILAVLVIPLTPGSFGLPGLLLAGSLVLVFSPSAVGWHRAGAVASVIALFCLNGMTHLISSPADTLLFATIPHVRFSRSRCDGGARPRSQKYSAFHAASFFLFRLCRPSFTGRNASVMDARQGIKATNSVTFCAEGRSRRDRRQPLHFTWFCLTPIPCKAISA